MNTGQMLLVIAALALLSTIALSVNSTLLDNDEISYEAQSGIMAVALCRGEIARRVAAGFDSLVVGSTVDTLYTPFSSFVCSTAVEFVEASSPDVVVADSTGYKRLSVVVSNSFMIGGVTLRSIVGDY